VARLNRHVAPSYLPFATEDLGTMVFHLYPGRDIAQSPILFVDNDAQEARFVCDRLASLPSALWLWNSTYLEDEPEILREATDAMANGIPEGKPVPEALWEYIGVDLISRWDNGLEQANKAWEIADVGHPFAGVPVMDFMTRTKNVPSSLEPFIRSRSDVPELTSVLLAYHKKIGLEIQKEDIMKILSAEMWQTLDHSLEGLWRERGEGICEWDCTLKNIENPETVLGGTPFEALIGHPETYSGKDREGPRRLLAVADAFKKSGDRHGELRQRRNAATLALITSGGVSPEDAMGIAEVCDAIETGSLAAAVVRESARVLNQWP